MYGDDRWDPSTFQSCGSLGNDTGSFRSPSLSFVADPGSLKTELETEQPENKSPNCDDGMHAAFLPRGSRGFNGSNVAIDEATAEERILLSCMAAQSTTLSTTLYTNEHRRSTRLLASADSENTKKNQALEEVESLAECAPSTPETPFCKGPILFRTRKKREISCVSPRFGVAPNPSRPFSSLLRRYSRSFDAVDAVQAETQHFTFGAGDIDGCFSREMSAMVIADNPTSGAREQLKKLQRRRRRKIVNQEFLFEQNKQLGLTDEECRRATCSTRKASGYAASTSNYIFFSDAICPSFSRKENIRLPGAGNSGCESSWERRMAKNTRLQMRYRQRSLSNINDPARRRRLAAGGKVFRDSQTPRKRNLRVSGAGEKYLQRCEFRGAVQRCKSPLTPSRTTRISRRSMTLRSASSKFAKGKKSQDKLSNKSPRRKFENRLTPAINALWQSKVFRPSCPERCLESPPTLRDKTQSYADNFDEDRFGIGRSEQITEGPLPALHIRDSETSPLCASNFLPHPSSKPRGDLIVAARNHLAHQKREQERKRQRGKRLLPRSSLLVNFARVFDKLSPLQSTERVFAGAVKNDKKPWQRFFQFRRKLNSGVTNESDGSHDVMRSHKSGNIKPSPNRNIISAKDKFPVLLEKWDFESGERCAVTREPSRVRLPPQQARMRVARDLLPPTLLNATLSGRNDTSQRRRQQRSGTTRQASMPCTDPRNSAHVHQREPSHTVQALLSPRVLGKQRSARRVRHVTKPAPAYPLLATPSQGLPRRSFARPVNLLGPPPALPEKAPLERINRRHVGVTGFCDYGRNDAYAKGEQPGKVGLSTDCNLLSQSTCTESQPLREQISTNNAQLALKSRDYNAAAVCYDCDVSKSIDNESEKARGETEHSSEFSPVTSSSTLETSEDQAVTNLTLELPPRTNLDPEVLSEKYVHVRALSFGAGGIAHVVRSKEDGQLWVAKIIDLTRLTVEEAQMAQLEAQFLRRLGQHPFILKCKESFVTPTTLMIITEYCEGGDLHAVIETAVVQQRLHKRGPRKRRETDSSSDDAMEAAENLSDLLLGISVASPNQVLLWISQIALGLQFMHSQRILHCDLKSSNVFLTADGTAKIGDFGIARELKNMSSVITPQRCPKGTPIYMSPEFSRRQELTEKADSWALGCILYELVFKEHAVDDNISNWRHWDSHSRLVSSRVQACLPRMRRQIRHFEQALDRLLAKRLCDKASSAKVTPEQIPKRCLTADPPTNNLGSEDDGKNCLSDTSLSEALDSTGSQNSQQNCKQWKSSRGMRKGPSTLSAAEAVTRSDRQLAETLPKGGSCGCTSDAVTIKPKEEGIRPAIHRVYTLPNDPILVPRCVSADAASAPALATTAASLRLIQELLVELLQPDPTDRPSLEDVVQKIYSSEGALVGDLAIPGHVTTPEEEDTAGDLVQVQPHPLMEHGMKKSGGDQYHTCGMKWGGNKAWEYGGDTEHYSEMAHASTTTSGTANSKTYLPQSNINFSQQSLSQESLVQKVVETDSVFFEELRSPSRQLRLPIPSIGELTEEWQSVKSSVHYDFDSGEVRRGANTVGHAMHLPESPLGLPTWPIRGCSQSNSHLGERLENAARYLRWEYHRRVITAGTSNFKNPRLKTLEPNHSEIKRTGGSHTAISPQLRAVAAHLADLPRAQRTLIRRSASRLSKHHANRSPNRL